MKNARTVRFVFPALALALLLLPDPARGKAHLWRFTEFFSNHDGSVQFIEMVECCGSSEEVRLSQWFIASDSQQYDFPTNLEGDTAHRWLLIATQAFADLPGAPTPDYIIPENFFDPAGDTLRYRMVDTVTIPPDTMPTNGIDSVDRDMNVQTNDPTNFAGESGSVNAAPGIPSLRGGAILGLVVAILAAGVALGRSPRSAPGAR